MTDRIEDDPLLQIPNKLVRAVAAMFVLVMGGSGFAYFKADNIGSTLSSVAMTAERNTIILGEVRDDVATLVSQQTVADNRYFSLSERVVVLEGQLRQVMEIINRSGNGK